MYRLILGLLLYLMCSPCSDAAARDSLDLHTGWQLYHPKLQRWIPATVPGVVQQDLIRQGLLPDPGYRTNEDSVQWVSELDWTYRLRFALSARQLAQPSQRLYFGGLDTFAEVWLNGQRILTSSNMYLEHELEVKGLLRRDNVLELRFASPTRAALPRYEASGINYPADNDHAPIHLSVFTRKAPYHYGWDWGERLLTLGPWRAVQLRLGAKEHFAGRPYLSYHPEAKGRELQLRLRPEDIAAPADTRLSYTLLDPQGREVYRREGRLTDFLPQAGQPFAHSLPNPQLWWPRGMGEQARYTARLELRRRGERQPLDSYTTRVGLRTLELRREADSLGRSFTFVVNGVPFFAKGANYIPGTLLLPTRSDEQLVQLFEDMRRSHFNMLRVWGGGVYESDRFYELADRYGILIWQDFMFACTPYPADSSFLEEVRQEVVQNVQRLRQHPSIATWCGNNEIAEALKYWGWQRKYPKETFERFERDYARLFRQLIPELLGEHDPLRPYIESSPDTANWGRPQEMGLGESHYWGVWYGLESFEILRERVPRFMSEFGVQSFPMPSSIRRFAREEDYDLESPVMRSHQKSSIGNDVILHYIRQEYPEPRDFEDFVYASQVMQGRGIALGIKAQRAAAPRCMGSLYWQLNDAWPAISWSGIDYWGAWKGLQYQAARAFAPYTILPSRDGRRLSIVWDEQPEGERRVRLEAERFAFDRRGEAGRPWSRELTLSGRSGVLELDSPLEELLPDETTKRQHGICYRLSAGSELLTEELYYALPPKELELPPFAQPERCELVRATDGSHYTLLLRSDRLLRDLYIDTGSPELQAEENFLDLLPQRQYCIRILPRAGAATPLPPTLPLKLKALNPQR